MLVFKRVCRVAWTGSNGLACDVLQSALHVYSKFVVGRRNALYSVDLRHSLLVSFPLPPGPAFSWFCVFPGVVPVSSLYGLSAWPTRPGTGPRGPRYSEALA